MMPSMDAIVAAARAGGMEVRENVPLRTMTTFKIGGNAQVVLLPRNEAQAVRAVTACRRAGVRPLVLGNGSNVLFPDDGYNGVILHLEGDFATLSVEGETIRCGAGVGLSRLCMFALENSLTGLEFAYGIPGSAGGGAFMNAGAYGGEMKDVIVSCRHITPEGTIEELSGDALAFGYRDSVYKHNGCMITAITLRLKRGDQTAIKAKMEELIGRRRAKQPVEYPSAGSVFKRPPDHFAGTLIEQCGLKGRRIGGAQVSEKHAGFIINTGGATCEDVKALIRLVQDTVREHTGVSLQPEVMMIK